MKLGIAVVALVGACGGGGNGDVDARGIAESFEPLPAKLVVLPANDLVGASVLGDPLVTHITVANQGGEVSGSIAASLAGSTDFAISNNACTVLARGATCMLDLSFTPSTSVPGAMITAQLTVQASPGGSATANLSGTGLPPNTLAIAPDGLDFPNTPVGSTGPTILAATVTNHGTTPTGALAVTLPGALFLIQADACSGQVVPAGGTCVVQLAYHPTGTVVLGTDGDHADLTIAGNPGGTAIVRAHGAGITLSVTPAPLNGGYLFATTAPGATSAARTFTITNVIGSPIGPLAESVVMGDATQFPFSSDTCNGKTLAAGASCAITAAFAPTTTGTKMDFLMLGAPMVGALRNDAYLGLFGMTP